MNEAFDTFQAECRARLEADVHYQMYLSAARNANTRELIETVALCFYIQGRLDERDIQTGGHYQAAIDEYEATVDRPT